MKVEILEEAVRIDREKKTHLARRIKEIGRFKVSAIASVLGVSRTSVHQAQREPAGRRTADDEELLARIKLIIEARPSFGYRSVTAVLRREGKRANHKRVYRLMKAVGLLLERFSPKPVRPHDGKVITLKSDLRWCTDVFTIRCWSGEAVHVAFSLDCCDREAISFVAAHAHLNGEDIRDLIASSVEERFGDIHSPHPVEWLSDNGTQFVANATRKFAVDCGLLPPKYSSIFARIKRNSRSICEDVQA